MKKLSNEELLAELEVPFPVDQVLWRVTNTANNRTCGQVVPYTDPRAYTDRLNALVSPQGWTRTYETVTMNNISRTKRNAEIEGVAKGEAVGGFSATRKLSRNH